MRLLRPGAIVLGATLLLPASAILLGAIFSSGCGDDAFATIDSGSGDGESPTDGASESALLDASGPDGSVTAFCKMIDPPPTFCADFDEADELTAYLNGQASNTLQRDTDPDAGADINAMTTGESLPNALVSVTPAITTNGLELHARLEQKQSMAKSHFHVGFDFRLDAYEQSGVRLFELHVDNPGLVVQWDIVAGGGNLHGNSMAPASSYTTPTAMPPAGTTWNHVEIDVLLTATHATMALVLNENLAGKVTNETATLVGTGVASFWIGLLSSNPASAARVSYDNVVYTED